MSRRYLVGTDGSDVSRNTLKYVRSHLDPERDSVLVFGVADESNLVPYMVEDETAIGGIAFDEIREYLEGGAKEAVQEGISYLEEADFSVEGATEFGDPGSLICEKAEDEDVDAIILGREGHTTMGELLLGSVSHYVVHHTEIPVTLVPMPGSDDE
jgi:nucleotide-binding universal stress UspA family protein